MVTDPLELPFDQYQRYRLVADVVERLHDERSGLRVLDVGGRTEVLRSFLPDVRIDLVDVEPSEAAGLVLGDGARLPFADASFDVVCAFDTLEHVPPTAREAFLREMARVARGHVLVAGPYAASEVDEAERILQSFLLEKLGSRHRYLDEHRHNGLPDRSETEGTLRDAGFDVETLGHGNVDRWLALMCVELYLDEDPKLRRLGPRLFRFYNERLYASDHRPPVYRHVVIATREGVDAPSLEGLLEPPGAPPDTVAAVTPFALELLALDRERDVWRPEIERLEGVIRGLEEDLEGHRARLGDTAADRDATRATVEALRAELEAERREGARERATLDADLAEHRSALEEARRMRAKAEELARELEGELAAVREEVGKRDEEVGRHKDVLAARERELAEHRDVLAARDAEIAEHLAAIEAERAEHVRLVAELHGELDEHRRALEERGHALAASGARVDDLSAELHASLERARAVEELADARERELQRMVALLRSRVGNFKRAFGLRKFGD